MTGFDLVVLALVPVLAFAGHRLGLLVSVGSFGGFFLGVLLGLAAAPALLGGLEPGPLRALLAFAVVVGLGMLCQLAGSFVGTTARDALGDVPGRRVDAALGALAALMALLAGAWMVGSAAARAGDLPFAASARDSRIVAAVGAGVPVDSDAVLAAFGSLVERSGFPAVFSEAGLERVAPVPAADPAVLDAPGVREAYAGLVKVLGVAPDCGRGLEGSGFVVGPELVMTNAHVVAGTDRVEVVRVDEAQRWPARVVAFDPATDVALLAVPGLPAPALALGPAAERGDDAVVAGFPGDGPLQAVPARVRARIVAVGQDIYGLGSVERDVYALRAEVRPGSSGGPVLDAAGRVIGLVFASSVTDASTGYALTTDAFTPVLDGVSAASAGVATGGCAL